MHWVLSLTLYILEAPPGRPLLTVVHGPGLSHIVIHTFRETRKVSITLVFCKIAKLVMYK